MVNILESVRKEGELVLSYRAGEDYLTNPGKIFIARISNRQARLQVSGAYQFKEYGSPEEVALFQQEEGTRRLEAVIKEVIAQKPYPLHITRRDNECIVAYRPEDDLEHNPDKIFLLIAGKNSGKIGIDLWGEDYLVLRSELLKEDNPQKRAVIDAMLRRINDMGLGRRIRF